MGLGTVKQRNTYLSVAGGQIWDRKAPEDSPHYSTQTFQRADGTEGTRQGAAYADLTGKIEGVEFRVHEKFGESINVTVSSEGETYILSVSTNNQYSQCLMKALLLADLEKDLFINPYDFVGNDSKRAQGISFTQSGSKLDLKTVEVSKEFQKDKTFFATSDKKKIKRFFEDLSDWLVGEVEQKVCPKLKAIPKTSIESEEVVTKKEEEIKVKDEVKPPSTIKMRRIIKNYVEENYTGESLPKLSKDEVELWYGLVLAEEELPFPDDNEVEGSDLDAELSKIL